MNYQEFYNELEAYMNQGEGRGNVVVSIKGIRAMAERHQTPTTPPTRAYPSTVEYLQDRDLRRNREASSSLKVH